MIVFSKHDTWTSVEEENVTVYTKSNMISAAYIHDQWPKIVQNLSYFFFILIY